MLEGLRNQVQVRTRLRRFLGLPQYPPPPRPEAPPPEISGGVGPGDFWAVGDRTVELLGELARLRSSDRVLDIGCGAGRVAWPLSLRLGPRGTYVGFDVVLPYVEWCRQSLNLDPARFSFEHHSLHSSAYNLSEKATPENFVFPWKERSFALAIATSLFTHLLPAATEHYLSEIHRVLKRKGRIFASFFLVDPGSIGAIESGITYPVFTERTEWGWLQDPKIPEDGVAFDRKWLLERLEGSGFTDVKVIEGTWRGPKARYYQDLVVARAS
jgi:SAM-dependent methyltransferase